MVRPLLSGALIYLLWTGLGVAQSESTSDESPPAGIESTAGKTFPDQPGVDWAVVISVLALIISVFSLWNARRMRLVAEKALVTGHRAWICIKDIEPCFPNGGNVPIAVNIRVVNGGRTPARDVHSAFELVTELKAPEGGSQPGPAPARPISPDGELLFTVEFDRWGSIDVCAEIDRRTRTLFLVGRIEYRDVFDEEHITEVALEYVPHLREFFAVGERNFLT